MKALPYLYQLPNHVSVWAAIALAITTYCIALLGPSPVIQGLAYLVYPAVLVKTYLTLPTVRLSSYFLITLSLFMVLWVTPSIVNLFGGTLEPEAINVPVISYHFIVIPLTLSWLYLWQKKVDQAGWFDFGRHLWLLITPIFIILTLKIGITVYLEGKVVAWGFTYRHLDAEMFLLWAMMVYFMRSATLKIIVTTLTLLAMTWMSVRGGLLALVIFTVLAYGVPSLKRLSGKKIGSVFVGGGILLALALAFTPLSSWLDSILHLTSPSRGWGSGITYRTEIWGVAWDNILASPWSGIGYYVRPNQFTDPINAGIQVHNLFLRIWVENGTPLFLFVVSILALTAWRIETYRLTWERAAFWAIIAYYFFIPRHIQLNPMTVILYLIIIRALISPSNNKLHKRASDV